MFCPVSVIVIQSTKYSLAITECYQQSVWNVLLKRGNLEHSIQVWLNFSPPSRVPALLWWWWLIACEFYDRMTFLWVVVLAVAAAPKRHHSRYARTSRAPKKMFNAWGETHVYGSATAAAAFHFWSRRFVGFLVIGVHHDFYADCSLDTFPNWESHYRSCDRILLLLHSYASNASIAAQETKASEADHHQCLTANSSSSAAAISTPTTTAPAPASSSS